MHTNSKKNAGYRAYAFLYRLFRIFPVNRHKAYFIATHDDSCDGNCGSIARFMALRGFKCRTLSRAETSSARFIIPSAFSLATSKYIFADNAFLPLAFLTLRKESILTMLWHGTGTIKKFGQHVNTGELKELEARCGRNINYVTVSSEATRKTYAECFAVPEERVKITGLPRCDSFFDSRFVADARAIFNKLYPTTGGRKLLLYAPTFRDNEEDREDQIRKITEFIDILLDVCPKNLCVALKLHPFVADTIMPNLISSNLMSSNSDKSCEGTELPSCVINFSDTVIPWHLLAASDALISDYSSIIFEYALLNRPILFYAYDLDKFEQDDRGFYRDYRSYVPGPVFTDPTALAEVVKEAIADAQPVSHDAFIKDSFAYTDGQSAERIFRLISGKNDNSDGENDI